MKKTDILIVGGGLSGLFAACVAADMGKTVQILSYGAATLSIAGGVIDVLGYDDNGKIVRNPLQAIETIDKEHPYSRVDAPTLEHALNKFLEITKGANYEYIGSADKNTWVPTAIGNFKPTCLVPKTMDLKNLLEAENIIVAGFDMLKDFYGNIVAKNLRKRLEGKNIQEVVLKLDLPQNKDFRDVSAMDIARWMETPEGLNKFIDQLKPHIKPNTAVVIPPVLGLEPNYNIFDKLQSALNCSFVEVSSIPPAVTGIRLEKVLLRYAKQRGVQIVKKAHAIGANIVDGKCVSIITEGFDREREFYADNFILATGGIYGGGLIAGIGSLVEPVFNINIPVPAEQTEWSNKQLFSEVKQPFAKFGVNTNQDLIPVNSDGNTIASNLRVIGKSLAGYDLCFEKSGNGVALITAYKAITTLVKEK